MWNNSAESCNVCQGGYIGISASYCLAKTSTQYFTATAVPTNCIQITSSGVCEKCAPTFYLDGTTCTSTCSKSIFWVLGKSINNCATVSGGALIAAKNAAGNGDIKLVCSSNALTLLKPAGEGSNLNWWKTANTNNSNTNLEVNASVYSIADRQQ